MFLFNVLTFFKIGDIIQGGTFFKGGHYLRKYGSLLNAFMFKKNLESHGCLKVRKRNLKGSLCLLSIHSLVKMHFPSKQIGRQNICFAISTCSLQWVRMEAKKIEMIYELFANKTEFKIVLFSSPQTINTYVVKLLSLDRNSTHFVCTKQNAV